MIIYFSATGNTKYCAEYLSSKTRDRIISLNDLMKLGVSSLDCEEAERLGIFAPVYDWDLAWCVSESLEGLNLTNIPEDCYAYGVFTCGSNGGRSADTLRKILGRKGITLQGAFTVSMPDNYVLMFRTETPERKMQHLIDADETLKAIADDVIGKRKAQRLTKKPPEIFINLVHKFTIPSQRMVKGFRVNDDCIGCGLCVKVCPMNIIELKDGRPVWTKDNCACCLSCLHRCPKSAINRGKSAKNGRYLNPNVSL